MAAERGDAAENEASHVALYTSRPLMDWHRVERPSVYDGDDRGWREWKFKLENWVTLLDARMPRFMQLAAEQDVEVPIQTEVEWHALQVQLYVVLASYLSGSALKIHESIPERNGFEAWRRLVREHEPKLVHQKLVLWERILNPPFTKSDDDQTFLHGLTVWESDVQKY